ncbi:hypothetical protein [Ideonella sp.]|uniref:hypothetical protein n=1 Tax=Ideonella sp. TaxID=1929293 RepID=UPI0035AE02E1
MDWRQRWRGPAALAAGLWASGLLVAPAGARPTRPDRPVVAASAPAPRASGPAHRAAAHEPVASGVGAPPFKRAHKEVADRPNRGGR